VASVDSLPPDQRAVLELVLRRGQSFEAIARLLSLDRAAVRSRALAALDALGPQTGPSGEHRALIGEYLLAQLPAKAARRVREQIATSPADRAWARVVAAELASLATAPLPEIPAATGRRSPARAVAAGANELPRPLSAGGAEEGLAAGIRWRPSSRRGGAILLASAAIAAIAAIVLALVLVVFPGSGGHPHQTLAANKRSTAAPAASARSATGAAADGPQEVAAARLSAPRGSRAAGAAEVIREAGKLAIVLVATGVPANSAHNFYAVWLANAAGGYYRLGFVKPPVKRNGRLETAGGLPSAIGAHLSEWKQLVVSLETSANPSKPGRVVLRGTLIFA